MLRVKVERRAAAERLAGVLVQGRWGKVFAMPSAWPRLRRTWLPASTSRTLRSWTTTREALAVCERSLSRASRLRCVGVAHLHAAS